MTRSKLPAVESSDLPPNRVLDLTRCRIDTSGPYDPSFYPDETFPRSGGSWYLVLTPFGSFIGDTTTYADGAIRIRGIGGHHLNAMGNQHAFEEAMEMAAQYETEYVYCNYGGMVRVGTPGSRLRAKLAAELASVEKRAEYLRGILCTLGGAP